MGDARIATHIYEDDCISNVYSIIHEAGHAAYELGVNPAYARTCLEGGTSMGIHESQSRFLRTLRAAAAPLWDRCCRCCAVTRPRPTATWTRTRSTAP